VPPRSRISILLTAAVLAAVARPAAAADPHIRKLDVTVAGNEVRIAFVLRGAVDPALARRLQSGLDTSIDYEIRLFERNRYWFDQALDKHLFRVVATYDPVSRDYVVRDFWDGRPLSVHTVRSFAEAADLLLSRADLSVFRVRLGWPHKHLYVKMRASYDAGNFFALAPVDSSTDWKKSKTFKIHDKDLR
jgi:hypothetical protein